MEINLEIVGKVLTYTEILVAIMASIFFYKYKNSPLKYLLIILWLVVFTEKFSNIIVEKNFLFYKNNYNFWLYNIMYPLWKIIYLIIFYKILNNDLFKKWVKRFIVIYCIALAVNWLFLEENFLTDLESYSSIIGALFVTVSSIFYLIELLRSDKIIIFHKKLMFWVSIGLMIFYSSSIPFIIMRSFYSKLAYIHNIFIIDYLLATLMYLLFTFGFIWSKKE